VPVPNYSDEPMSPTFNGSQLLSSAESPVITTEWKAYVGLTAQGIGAGLSDITLFSRGSPSLGSSPEMQSCLQ